MERAGDRRRLIHAKDIAADGSMVDVGSGTLDFDDDGVPDDDPPDARVPPR